ncbi:MAG: hypothetical protein K8J08_05630 [Thermoanaerobaculia bacterium]|nr:hypothetical protein [Thermoanaerobaculia bacterium]
MNTQRLWIALIGLCTVLTLTGCGRQSIERSASATAEEPVVAQDTDHTHDAAASGEDAALQLARTLIGEAGLFAGEVKPEDQDLVDGLVEDIHNLDFAGDSAGDLPAKTLFAENPLLAESNPLVTKANREQWLAAAIRNVGTDMALAHLEEETAKLESGEVSRSEWYEHVANCEMFCNRVVTGLLYEHIQKVQSLPRELVLFGTSSHSLDKENLAKLHALTSGREGSEILLIGRASRSGNLEYNRQLSEQRVASTKKALQEMGFGSQQIHGFWLGYEPPQITPELAERYDLDPSLPTEVVNQSVLAVAYTVEEAAL